MSTPITQTSLFCFTSPYLRKPFISNTRNAPEAYTGKLRLTDIAAAIMNDDKLSIFVIVKSNKLGCFKHVKKLLCCYSEQKKSWMDSQLFEYWVMEVDDQLKKKTGRLK